MHLLTKRVMGIESHNHPKNIDKWRISALRFSIVPKSYPIKLDLYRLAHTEGNVNKKIYFQEKILDLAASLSTLRSTRQGLGFTERTTVAGTPNNRNRGFNEALLLNPP